MLVKILAIISLTPIIFGFVILVDNDFLQSNTLVIIPIILFPLIFIFLVANPKKLVDKFHYTSEGIQGAKNEIIKWNQIKSFYWKNDIRGSGNHITIKLKNNQSYHFTPSTWDSENLSHFFEKFKELKPKDMKIKIGGTP